VTASYNYPSRFSRFSMHTGSELLETWIPDGGFEIAKRRLKTGGGGSALADCLVPKWADDELTLRLSHGRRLRIGRGVAWCENPQITLRRDPAGEVRFGHVRLFGIDQLGTVL